MEISEAQKLKKEAEEKILAVVTEFHNATNLTIEEIKFAYIQSFDNVSKEKPVGAYIKIVL